MERADWETQGYALMWSLVEFAGFHRAAVLGFSFLLGRLVGVSADNRKIARNGKSNFNGNNSEFATLNRHR